MPCCTSEEPTSAFPDTRHTLVSELRSDDPRRRDRAADLLVRAYRAPLLAVLQRRWQLSTDDAEDVVQEFLAAALQHDWLARFDPERGRVRTFLRLAADRFASNRHQAARRIKRGGAQVSVPLEAVELPGPDGEAEADRFFRAEWARSVFTLAVERLEAEAEAKHRRVHVALFRQYDLARENDDPPTYAELARQHALSETQVINHLAWARRRCRVHVLSVLQELAGSEAEYRDDVRELLGIDAP